MIIQGSNSPIVMSFDNDASSVKDWSLALYGEDKRGRPSVFLKHWDAEDLVIDGSIVYAPLSEEETFNFMPCVASLEIKWLDDDDVIYHSEVVRIRIRGRNDKTPLTVTTTDSGNSASEGSVDEDQPSEG